MILNILFFIAWTAVIIMFLGGRQRQWKNAYDEACDRLTVRSKQVDILLDTIDCMNKEIRDKRD